MNIKTSQIEEHNGNFIKSHNRDFDYLLNKLQLEDTDPIIKKISDFQVAIPAWALGIGGTRFGRFSGGGEPRSLADKVEDIGLLHALNRSSGTVSISVPWDVPSDFDHLRSMAEGYGLQFGTMNSNTFQDQAGQQLSYKHGSMHHVDPAVRKQAIAHNIEVINYGVGLGAKSINVWLADGSSFPGQLNFRKAFERTLSSLEEVYAALPEDWKIFVEYKPFEPNFYSMTSGDWGQSYNYVNKLGPKAYTLVDLGHHLPGVNVEQIVSLLLMDGKLGGFHLNDSKYADDDLTVGCINPYQLFLIFNELVEGMDRRGMTHATDLDWMIDASHNVKEPLEDLLQSVEAIMIAYTQALLVDSQALEAARDANDAVAAQEILQGVFRTDVRPLVAEARMRAGGALDPLALFRTLDVRENLIAERGNEGVGAGL